MKILIVDKHILFRDGLASMLAEQPGFTILGGVGTAEGALEKTREHKPDVVLMNINLPDGNGLDLIKKILFQSPDTKIVILTESEEENYFLTAIRNGAKGFLRKNIPVTELIKSICALDLGQAAITRTMTNKLINELHRVGKVRKTDEIRIQALTFREEEVLKCLGNGSSNQEIASQLSISENTVRVHVNKILRKLGLRNRREVYHFLQHQSQSEPHKEQTNE